MKCLTKLRVYEYAKQLNMSSKEIITILNRLDVPVANHMSVMDEAMVQKVEQFFREVKQRAAQKHASEVERELRERQRQRERAAREAQRAAEHSASSGETAVRGTQRGSSPRPSERPQAMSGAGRPERSQESADRASAPAPQRTAEAAGGVQTGAQATARPATDSPSRRQGDTRGGAAVSDRGPSRGGQGQRDGQGYRGPRGPRPGRDQRDGQYGRGGRPGGGFGASSGGERRGGPGAQAGRGGPRPEGGRGGRPGGGFGGRGPRPGGPRPIVPPAPVAQKPVSPTSQRKEKERERSREELELSRKESFNENKLIQQKSGKRRETQRQDLPSEVVVEGPMTVGEFAKLLRREPSEIIKKLLFLGIMATINQDIDTDAMELIADDYGVKLTVKEPVDEEALDMLVTEDNPEDLRSRPPVVTIMGHVDHGKTTLLDAIRQSRVAQSEAGGITQHIGAYQVKVGDRLITFLDTPGHEAFTTMRARGAQVTDVTILVVAADDGVMPQTIEAINHAKAANVPIIVAINKMDKPDANPDRVKQELAQHGLVPEDWGGDTVCVPISALRKEGLDTLLEMVLLVADMQELKANPTARPRGTVIEAKLDKGRGPVATVLVQNGTLRVGDIVVAGTTYGRVRAMTDDMGKRLKEAGPSTPVEIQGLNDVPSAGDRFVVYDDERSARQLVEKRLNRARQEQLQATARVTLDDLYRQIQEGNVKELHVIVKADVQGSVEALVHSIEKIDVEGVRVKVIHRGVGGITESDVSLAMASNAVIIGFNVRPDVGAKRAAEQAKVDIRMYRVIYDVIEELQQAMKGLLEPEYKEVVIGHAEVRQTFHISKVGTVAGCYVTDGRITRDAQVRLVRDGIVVYEGHLDSLKRFKDDVREVAQGFECGLTLDKFQDVKVGDVIEAFKMEAVKPQ